MNNSRPKKLRPSKKRPKGFRTITVDGTILWWKIRPFHDYFGYGREESYSGDLCVMESSLPYKSFSVKIGWYEARCVTPSDVEAIVRLRQSSNGNLPEKMLYINDLPTERRNDINILQEVAKFIEE